MPYLTNLLIKSIFLAPQSGALRIGAYRDFHPTMDNILQCTTIYGATCICDAVFTIQRHLQFKTLL